VAGGRSDLQQLLLLDTPGEDIAAHQGFKARSRRMAGSRNEYGRRRYQSRAFVIPGR
jgi:hypothetical protein